MYCFLPSQRKDLAWAWLYLLTLAKLVEAAPQGGQVVSGQAVIQQSTQSGQAVTIITQSSNKATLNWQSFNIGSGESVRFVQPGTSAVSINRISDPNGSKILGNLSANGQVWLINPAGVYFGPGAQVNVGGLVASTLNLADSADPYKMQGPVSAGNNTASVTNQGSIQTMAGGYVALLGSNVSNTGDIHASGGRILLLGDKLSGTVELSGRLDTSGGQNQHAGFVETSAANVHIADSASVFTRSADGSSGNWLIDPTNFTISSGSGASTTSSIGSTTLSTSLASSSVSIATDNSSGSDSGNIYVNSAVSWTAATTLSLSAYKDIYINAPITSTSTSGVLKLLYGQGSTSGTISGVASDYYVNAPLTLAAGVNFYTQLGSDTANLKSFQVITSLGSHGSTTGTDLQGINGGLSANYALGADIDASDTTSWYTKANYYGFTKIGDNDNDTGTETFFSGTFAGLGHTLSSLYMYQPDIGVSGMFAGLSTTGVIRDTGLVGMDITTNSSGGLVGRNRGTVKNSFSTGSITSQAGFVGGLVGDNSTGTGTVTDSYSSASVIVSNSADIPAGGLVGRNYHTITSSYASGAVSGSSGYTGGLVGELKASGSISASVWNTSTSGQSSGYASVSAGSSSGVTGLSSSNMQLSANYSSWNFTTPWIIYSGYTEPLLRAFMTPLTITASASGSQTYDGTTTTTLASYTDPGTLSKNLYGSISFALDGSGVGTHSAVASGYYSDQLGYQVSYSFTTNSVSINSASSSSSAYVPSINTISAASSTLSSVTDSTSGTSTQTTTASAVQRSDMNGIAANAVTPASSSATTEAANTKPSGKAMDSPILNVADDNNQAFTFPATDNPELVSSKKQSHLNLPSTGDSNTANTGLPGTANSPDLSHSWNAELSVDNYGSSYTGLTQTTLRQQHKQLFTDNDNLEMQFLTGSDLMKYLRLAYDRPLGDAGWNIGMSQTNLNYRLGGSAASLDAYGTAKQHSLWAGRSVFGSNRSQWQWRAQFDRNALQDIETTSGTDNDRSLQLWRLSLSASQADSAGVGRSWLNLEAGRGNLQFNNDDALATDAAAANTQGSFNRYTLSSGRLQPLNSSTQLLLHWQGQWATHNLDSTQKMSMGGAHSVRAYTPGALSGDAGHLLTAEIKHRLGPPGQSLNVSGDFYTSVFIDAGWLTLYQAPYASGSNQARLAGAGLGLYWEGPNHWRASLGVSKRIGSAPSQLSGSSYTHDNAWVELVKGFH